jgi:transposase-like protein
MSAAEGFEPAALRAEADPPGASARISSGFPVRPATRHYSMAWRADCIAHTQAEIARGGNVSAIAQRLHMSDTTIIRWFVEAGFDPPTRSAEDQRREEIIARATEMRAAGQTLRAIAAELHTCEKRLSEWLRRRRGFNSPRKDEPTKGKKRDCLTCSAPFWSEGPHNRMCPGCRSYASSASPMAPGGESRGRWNRAARP